MSRTKWRAGLKLPSDGEIANFYIENRATDAGSSARRNDVRSFAASCPISGSAKREPEMIADLRKAGPTVRVLFDAPRQQVATDAATIGSRTRLGTGHAGRVLRLSVSVLSTRDADAETDSREIWRQGSGGLEGLSAHPDSPRGLCRRGCRAIAHNEQGKFWELHDRLFPNQQALQPEFLKRYAADAGVDPAKFDALPRFVQVSADASRMPSTPDSAWACPRRRRSS